VYLPATVLYRGVSFARGLVLAWLLSGHAGQYGLLSVALQVINVLAPLASLGVAEAVTRYVPAYEREGRLGGLLAVACVTAGLLGSIAGVLLLVGREWIWGVFFGGAGAREGAELSAALAACVWGLIAYLMLMAVVKGLRFFRALAVLELFHGAAFLALAVWAVVRVRAAAVAVVYSYCAALLLTVAVFASLLWGWLRRLGERDRCVPLGQTLSRLLKFGVWAAAAGVAWQGLQLCSLWYLGWVRADVVFDSFAATRLLGQVIAVFAMAVAAVVMTQVNKYWEQNQRHLADRQLDFYAKVTTLGLLAVSVVMTAGGRWLFKLLPAEFSAGVAVLPEVLLFYLLGGMVSFQAIHFSLIEKTRLMLWSWSGALLANVVLVARWCRGAWALEGAASSAAAAMAVAMVIALVLVHAERRKVNVGLVVTFAATGLLLCPLLIAVGGLVVVVVLSVTTNVLFDVRQKELFASYYRKLEKLLKGS